MSIAEIERFAADVSSNAALRADAERVFAQASQRTSVDSVIAFAAANGYSFTETELTEHARGKIAAAKKKLSDAELDGVSAGGEGFLAAFMAGFVTQNLGKSS
ncbi:MAG: Nif11-like leader peptide family natural product precursor [Reyranellaceae bacterium]